MPNKSILITGCSSGMGLAAATGLKEKGYRVFASARKENDIEKLQSLGLESVELDVTDSDSMHQALETILGKTNGTLDALFNNAGFMQAGAIEDLTPEVIHAQFDTNVFGPIELIRLVLPTMRKQGHGRIIQNSSILGIVALPYYGAYNASKFALEGFTDTLRLELHGTGIYVSTINPGPITTALRDNAFQHYQDIDPEKSVHQERYHQLEKAYFDKHKKNKMSLSSDAIIKPLIHALESKHPKAHYYLGMPAKTLAFFKRILPDSALDFLLSKAN